MATNLKQKRHKVKLGQKLCHQCINKYKKIMNEPEEITIDENETETEEEFQIEDDSTEYEESPRKKLNTSLNLLVFPTSTFMLYHSTIDQPEQRKNSKV